METRLLGLRACEAVLLGGGLGLTAAMEIRLGWKRLLVFFVVVDPAVILGMFSLPYADAMEPLSHCFGRGDGGGGKRLVSPRKGSLNLEEGANGGFFSITVFCAACFRLRDDSAEGGAEAAVKALVSCLSLVFLS
ncbi:hypothetical protein PanWU01x14_034500, partial [Parasponia andersonii]